MIAPIVRQVRDTAEILGQQRDSINAFAAATIVTGETDTIARAKYEDLLSYADYDGAMVQFAGPVGVGGMGPTIVGSGATVADELEWWAEVADLDGFNLAYAVRPGTYDDIIRYLVPELRRRGLLRPRRQEGTFRETLFGTGRSRLLPDHPHRGIHR